MPTYDPATSTSDTARDTGVAAASHPRGLSAPLVASVLLILGVSAALCRLLPESMLAVRIITGAVAVGVVPGALPLLACAPDVPSAPVLTLFQVIGLGAGISFALSSSSPSSRW